MRILLDQLFLSNAQSRIDPILYHTVAIRSFNNCEALANVIQSRNDPLFFARHVKRLCVHQDVYYPDDLQCLLDTFTGLRYLAWWCDTCYLLPYVDTSLTSVRYLSTVAEIDSPLAVETLLPRNITQLNVQFDEFNVVEDNLTAVWQSIFTRCPFLTHIMVDFYPSSPPAWATEKEQFVRSALSVAPPTLKAFIIESMNPAQLLPWNASDFGPFLTDPRLIIVGPDPCYAVLEGVVCYPTRHDPLLEWEYPGATMDIWEFVHSHLRSRRSNELRAGNGSTSR